MRPLLHQYACREDRFTTLRYTGVENRIRQDTDGPLYTPVQNVRRQDGTFCFSSSGNRRSPHFGSCEYCSKVDILWLQLIVACWNVYTKKTVDVELQRTSSSAEEEEVGLLYSPNNR